MLVMLWNISTVIHDYLQRYMPTNRAITWLRTPRGLKWAIPVALIATPAYLCAMVLAVAIIDTGGPGWLHLLVLWSFWNATKFAWIALFSIPLMLGRAAGVLIGRSRAALPKQGRAMRAEVSSNPGLAGRLRRIACPAKRARQKAGYCSKAVPMTRLPVSGASRTSNPVDSD